MPGDNRQPTCFSCRERLPADLTVCYRCAGRLARVAPAHDPDGRVAALRDLAVLTGSPAFLLAWARQELSRQIAAAPIEARTADDDLPF